MKSMTSISLGLGLLLSQPFGSAMNLMEGDVAKEEAVEKVERFAAFQSTGEATDRTSTVENYQQVSALQPLKATIALEVLPLLAESKATAKQMRLILETIAEETEDDESVSD
ncbi:MAG: hypothetical protein Q8Q56_00250 [Alphaproteobacteria bacterium]|nr:hypothetical protein [Alphaproteobacteria bacterium]